MQQQNSERVAWVTGASGAIGRAIVSALARESGHVFISSRNGQSLEDLARELKPSSTSARITVLPMDVVDQGQVDAAARTVTAAGRLDVLVNSTTRPIFGDPLELADADWDAVMQAKFMGYLRTMRAVLPLMQRQRGGCIVNISGRGGHQPTSPAHLPGSAANAAVNVLTKGLANIYGPHGIRINAIAPGPIASERYDRIAAANQKLGETSAGQVQAPQAPLGNVGQPADIADAVCYLASDRARHVTGIVLQVDGGGTASL